MTEDVQGRKSRRIWLALALLVAILAVLVVPPMVSIARYKTRITHLMSASLNRPVHLSSVELRLLPRPGFVLNDLTVDEDPGYGLEPLMHANTVTASIRLWSLWRGRLVIDSISVDEASLNLTRNQAGRWNLDSLFRTAAAGNGPKDGKREVPLPYLEATNSRINVKNGAEKLPFSLMNTDVSFWQPNPGDWRIRLRGQPARTDVNLDLGDTGVVRLEARLQRAPELRQVPIHLDLDWKEAQLGQLTRLLLGSDPGWRGDLTGELHLDGTPENAQIKTRLRAEGVHRAEFAPVAPLDFDAHCGLVYHFVTRAMENLVCESPLGNGKIRVAGNLSGEAGQPQLSVELDRIPVAAALDALRTVRSDFGPGLEARGAISGKLNYAAVAPEDAEPLRAKPATSRTRGKAVAAVQGPLTGSFAVDGFELSGDGLGEPIRIPKVVLEPAEGEAQAIVATVAIPAGGTVPLTVSARLSTSGYQMSVHGQASIARARELAKITGATDAELLNAVAGDPLTADLTAQGPWVPVAEIPLGNTASGAGGSAAPGSLVKVDRLTDRLSGTVTLHNSNWHADYLANAVMISTATAHFGGDSTRWDPVVFSYGPVKGTASVSLPQNCAAPQPCLPVFEMQFAELDASALEAAILGAKEKVTLISTLLDKLRPAAAPVLPEMEGTIKAQALILGPLTVKDVAASVRILSNGAHITALDAVALGGKLHAAGSLYTAASDKDKPQYMFEAQFQKVNPAQVGQLVGQRWAGGDFDAGGKVELSGFTEKELVDSAKGTLHFDWANGTIGGGSAVPAELARFNKWSADAVIGNGLVTLTGNQVQRAGRRTSVEADATLGTAAKVRFAPAKEAQAKR